MNKEKEKAEVTNNKLNKAFIEKLYLPSYKPSIYGSKIKENYTLNIASYSFEEVNTDAAIKNISKITGNIPSIPTMEELQKSGQTAYNLVINGSLITEANTEPQTVERFVVSLNSLKSLYGFDSIEKTYDSTNDIYNIKSISVDNKLKRVTFSKIEM